MVAVMLMSVALVAMLSVLALYARRLCATLHARIDRRAVCLSNRLGPDRRRTGRPVRRRRGVRHSGAPVRHGALAHPAPDRGADLRRPAAIAGYAIVYGVTRESIPSEVWRQIFCIVGGGFVGVSALLRLTASADMRPT